MHFIFKRLKDYLCLCFLFCDALFPFSFYREKGLGDEGCDGLCTRQPLFRGVVLKSTAQLAASRIILRYLNLHPQKNQTNPVIGFRSLQRMRGLYITKNKPGANHYRTQNSNHHL